jgi:solute:Na+ symporter, SSS family
MSTVVFVRTTIAIITMVGGFTAVAYTDSIQTGIMIAGCSLVLFSGLHRVGGWHELLSRMPEAMHLRKAYDDPNYPIWGVIMDPFSEGLSTGAWTR